MASAYDKASLVMLPHAVKEGKLYSVKPENRSGDFTFSRGTDTATRVNASGLIEKERSNQLLQSNSFATTWIDVSTNKTSGQSGYDGSNDAWLLSKTNSSARLYQNITYSGVNTFSVYAKSGTLNWMMLNNGTNSVWYDLQNGVVGTNSAGGGSLDASIESVGNGWYRVVLVSKVSASLIRIYPSQANNDVSGTSGNIYIQDAQLEQGLVATSPAIETTTAAVYEGITDNLPRLDYSGGASCPSLLLEPSRTNLMAQSEYIGLGTSFSYVDGVSFISNDTISPEGFVNATKATKSGSGVMDWYPSYNGNGFTQSIFVKPEDSYRVYLTHEGTGSGGYISGSCQFNLSTFEKTLYGMATAADIEDYGNGWYRVWVTYSESALSGSITRVGINDNGVQYFYGYQIEYGSYPTSYIPTYGASASRAGDYSILNGMQDYVSADEGTWFMHFKDLFFDITGTGQGSINLVYNSGNQIEFIQDGNIQYKITLNNSTAIADLDGEDKVAIAWSTSGLVIYINGESRYTTSSSAYANPYAQFELTRVDRRPRVDMKQILFFKTRLTNAELESLTTL